ncbi:MAG TPA: DUF1588 domain-containing protein [Polyangiaceae bacterium]|nr:DUF1588 domain-containing protein [Polyangiaceae bacterium]
MRFDSKSPLPLFLLALACGEATHALGDGAGPLGAAGATSPDGNGDAASAGTGGNPPVIGDACDEDSPPELAPPFASPEVVWQRISRFVADAEREAPSALPDEVSPEWAGEIALAAFDRELEAQTAPAGMRRFIARWLSLPTEPEPALDRDWAAMAAADGATLRTLLTFREAGEPDRVGIFADSFWLTEYERIPRRASTMHRALNVNAAPLPPSEPTAFDVTPGMTAREWYVNEVSPPVCAGCHTVIDPYGFALEHFDEVGEYRETDGGKPVDASGWIVIDDVEVSFTSIADLAPRLAESCQAGRAVSQRFLADALLASGTAAEPVSGNLSHVVLAYPADEARINRAFFAGGRTIRALVEGAARSEAMLR